MVALEYVVETSVNTTILSVPCPTLDELHGHITPSPTATLAVSLTISAVPECNRLEALATTTTTDHGRACAEQ